MVWHYLAVEKLSALLRGIMSQQVGDFYCLNCLHLFRIKNKLRKVCENKDFCGVTTQRLPKKLRYYSLINTKNLKRHYLLFLQILNL